MSIIKKYSSPYSALMLFCTFIVYTILLFALYYWSVQLQTLSTNSFEYWWRILSIVLVMMVLIYGYMSQIRGVEITDDAVVIRKMYGKITIPFSKIGNIEHKKNMSLDIRLFGMSGLFGHIGYFWNNDIGLYTAYANNGHSLITIKTQKKVYVVSCDNHLEVIKRVKSYLVVGR